MHPDAPGTYLAGIECDGATYHRSATARDRDKLREHVLRGLGWEILRIWSTDWWIDREGTLEVIQVKLKALLEASRTMRAARAEKASTPSGPAPEQNTAEPSTEEPEFVVITPSRQGLIPQAPRRPHVGSPARSP